VATPGQVPQVNDDRLCWLAVREQLNRRAGRPGLRGWFAALAGGSMRGTTGSRRLGTGASQLGGDVRREARSDAMADFAFAVDEAAGDLSAEERRHLRATGEVPEWFLGEVERRAAAIRKRR
jgi:hypothetical protein